MWEAFETAAFLELGSAQKRLVLIQFHSNLALFVDFVQANRDTWLQRKQRHTIDYRLAM